MTRLNGRCECGIREDLATGPEHLACRGERRCKTCGEVKPLAEFHHYRGQRAPTAACKPCYRVEDAAYGRSRMAVPSLLARHREVKRASERRIRRAGGASYVRDKEEKRLRYQTDAAWRERKLDATRERRRLAKNAAETTA